MALAFEPTELRTQRLVLEPVCEAHALDERVLQQLYDINGNERVTKHLPYPAWPSVDESKAWIERTVKRMAGLDTMVWLMRLKQDDQSAGTVIGNVLIFKYVAANQSAELGYVQGEAVWGQGHMLEATRAACRWAFEQVGIFRLQAQVVAGNDASERVLQKLGFQHEGCLRQADAEDALGSVRSDLNVFGLLRPEFRPTVR